VANLGETFAGRGRDQFDLVVDEDHLGRLITTTARNPLASIGLVVLLRSIGHLPVAQALAAESAVYSMLQGSGEFRAWRGTTTPTTFEEETVVEVERHGTELVIMLDRPHRHNAVTRQLRDELCVALRLAIIDHSITSVLLAGRGASFCSGGDLAEFGARPDPSLAHRVRLAQSPAILIHQLRERTTVRVHGATLGGGIEMAAFAGRVIADPATRIGLPEVGLGLIPGAGGTVSLTRRAGRQRVAALALAVDAIDAETAHEWGLVDEIAD
jgi:1,4-dihydroxy-2-naphthoyl-CoA synthase